MRLQEFDLNNDGIFTDEEVTAEQKEECADVRKVSVYTGLIY